MGSNVKTEHVCRKCGTAGEVHHGQSCASGRVTYWASFRCAACEDAFEADGPAPPDDIRELMLQRRGRWSLSISAKGEVLSSAVRMLSHRLGISLAAALELVRRTPSEIATGTRVEMECLAVALRETGATVSLGWPVGVSAELCFHISARPPGPIGCGMVGVIDLLRNRLALSLSEAKALVDAAAVDGSDARIDVESDALAWAVAHDLAAVSSVEIEAWVERGRFGQDTKFEVPELSNQRVQRLIAAMDKDRPDNLYFLYVKAESPAWNRFFLDAFVAFWEDWGKCTDDDADDAIVRVELGERFQLEGDVVARAWAEEVTPGGSAQFRIAFRSGTILSLDFADPHDVDSDVHLSVKRPGEAATRVSATTLPP